MKKPPPEQLGFDLEAEDTPRRPGRRRRRRSRDMSRAPQASGTRRGEADRPLLTAPVVRRCGLCGVELTIMGQAAVCPVCGGIVGRQVEQDTG